MMLERHLRQALGEVHQGHVTAADGNPEPLDEIEAAHPPDQTRRLGGKLREVSPTGGS